MGRLGTGPSSVPSKLVFDVPETVGLDFQRAFETRLVEASTESWEFLYGLLQSFGEREGHLRVPARFEERGHRLGPWVSNQRAKRQRLPFERVSRLEALPDWTWDAHAEQWDESFQILHRYLRREGHVRVPREHVEGGFRLGGWVRVQRTAYKRGTLPADRQLRLEATPGWSWDLRADRWQVGLDHLRRFVEREGLAVVSDSHVEDGYALGKWVGNQRTDYRAGRLAARRASQLEATPGWSWNVLDQRWEESFRLLEQFIEREGHALVPQRHIENGIHLGAWTSAQRKMFLRGNLDPDRARRLEEQPGWTWDGRVASWEYYFEALQKYVSREGNAAPPAKYVEGDVRIGWWVVRQRSAYEQGLLRAQRISRLESLTGWTWDVLLAQWEEGFQRLRQYTDREVHANVPSTQWVTTQRSAYRRGKLDSERIRRLEAVQGWVWDPRQAQWEQALGYLRSYVAREGNAAVPGKHVEDGFRLGQWIFGQRQAYRKGKLKKARADRLDALPGWVWDAREG